MLSEELIRRAQRSTGQGLTPTIRRGLEILAASDAYNDLRSMKGEVDLKIDQKSMRKDRRGLR
jgi:hypothetical protein